MISASEKSLMKGADIVVDSLVREGTEIIFGYPGGASMEIHQAITRVEEKGARLRLVLVRHEQGGGFAAQGYARATGKPGVVLTTSGPGATNLVTPVADAMMDSVPIICITGQVPTAMIGRDAFQETDVTGVTRPITKHAFLVKSLDDLPVVIHDAFKLAVSGRPGPVVVDIPKDVQQSVDAPPGEITRSLFRKSLSPPDPPEEALKKVAEAIAAAHKPVLYVGGGAVASGAAEEIRALVEKCRIPVAQTLLGLGVVPGSHPLFYGMLGMHGSVASNYAVHHADLLLAFGVRFDDRVTGKLDEFCKHGTIVHIDIDASELNKNKRADIGIVADLKESLKRLLPMLQEKNHDRWIEELDGVRRDKPFHIPDMGEKITPQAVLSLLNQRLTSETIVTTGVGQHQMFAAQFLTFEEPRRWLTSGGLGTMGFGLPAAMGAQLARPEATVINIDGDGSFQMNIQELATCYSDRIPVKSLILNNQHLGMVAQWEDRFYGANRAHTYIGDPEADGPYPDFVAIAQGYRIPGRRVTKLEEVADALDEMLAAKTAFVLDVITPYQEHVLPMIPSGKTFRDLIYR
ncbi:MAG: biosynthetic-type acetolactate synthase large subunit [Candidatus Hydrogenedentota bacterium]|nr:MAG: biosynthetic-type acetolactate synthase large subunit [Candidatus Hydrogenedentota bacterium]